MVKYRTHFPSTTIRVLEGHEDEVWHVSFSHNGRYLSSASKDKTCIIWDLEASNGMKTEERERDG